MKCERGHPITPKTIYLHPKLGIFECKTCKNEACARYRDRKRGRLPRHNSHKTHCINGHPLYGVNLTLAKRKEGYTERRCRACNNGGKLLETRNIHQFIAEHVPRFLPPHDRQEVVTLLVIQILEHKFKIHEVAKHVKKAIRLCNKQSGMSRRDRSLDAPLSIDNAGTLHDLISEERALWR